ncbi:hypothetical protein CDV31_017084 [Fusarium ambrosium]|uniref:Uncharacterized protein n=1 Tax=Fusarium ambrosium TaxID=131363 RepID=A0A428RTG8_9HYPO|nr:hypothetical protein CDV31_017084 [Fusarium ambrosium]
MDIDFQKQASVGCYVVSDNPYGTRLAAEGDEHGCQRKTLVSGFSTQPIKALSPIFSEKPLLPADRCTPYLEWLNGATLGIIGKAGLDYDINPLEHLETPIRTAYRLMLSFDSWSHVFIADQDKPTACGTPQWNPNAPDTFARGEGFAACSARMNSGAMARRRPGSFRNVKGSVKISAIEQ